MERLMPLSRKFVHPEQVSRRKVQYFLVLLIFYELFYNWENKQHILRVPIEL